MSVTVCVCVCECVYVCVCVSVCVYLCLLTKNYINMSCAEDIFVCMCALDDTMYTSLSECIPEN